MSIVYGIEDDMGAALVVWDGPSRAESFQAHARRLMSDPRWPARAGRHLADLRTAVLDASIDQAVLKAIADLYGTHPRIAQIRAAVVVGEAFEKAEAFAHFISGYRPSVIVFNSLDIACTWLGIRVDEAEPRLERLRREARRDPAGSQG
jgi:hypothetical protein